MELVKHRLCDIEFNMVDIRGKLYCGIGHLMEGFDIDEEPLKKAIHYKGSGRLSKIYLGDVIATCDLSLDDQAMLASTKVDRNTRLWTEDDIPELAWILDCEVAKVLRGEMTTVLKGKATRTCNK